MWTRGFKRTTRHTVRGRGTGALGQGPYTVRSTRPISLTTTKSNRAAWCCYGPHRHLTAAAATWPQRREVRICCTHGDRTSALSRKKTNRKGKNEAYRINLYSSVTIQDGWFPLANQWGCWDACDLWPRTTGASSQFREDMHSTNLPFSRSSLSFLTRLSRHWIPFTLVPNQTDLCRCPMCLILHQHVWKTKLHKLAWCSTVKPRCWVWWRRIESTHYKL